MHADRPDTFLSYLVLVPSLHTQVKTQFSHDTLYSDIYDPTYMKYEVHVMSKVS